MPDTTVADHEQLTFDFPLLEEVDVPTDKETIVSLLGALVIYRAALETINLDALDSIVMVTALLGADVVLGPLSETVDELVDGYLKAAGVQVDELVSDLLAGGK